MTWAVLLGAAATLALAGFGPGLSRRLPPPIATRLLGAAAVLIAAITSCSRVPRGRRRSSMSVVASFLPRGHVPGNPYYRECSSP